jgi:hypothetical protein
MGPNDGTLMNGASFEPGKVRQAFSFDGVDDWVIGDGTGMNDLQQLTIETWVKLNELPLEYQYFVMLDGVEKAVLRYDGINGPGQLHFFMRIDGSLWHVRANNALQVAVFHHVAGTYDGNVMRLFVDGVEVGNFAVSGMVAVGNNVALSSPPGPAPALNGAVDEVTIYDRALTASEIQAIFDAGGVGKCEV